MINEIGTIILFSIGILTGEYLGTSMGLITLISFNQLKGGKK